MIKVRQTLKAVVKASRAVALVYVLLATSAASASGQDFAKWRYYRTINFNTTATGANVKGDVRNYPVAVALDAQNFDFSQARNDGADIRFSGAQDSQPLPHHIEHWDRNSQTALIWVKVSTVRGNSAAQAIFMHWGNAEATAASDSKAVFDTKEGFVGVWHFNEEGNAAEGGYKDATANAADGTGVNLKPGVRGEGRLGRALELNYPDKQWVKIDGPKRKLFDLTTRVTFSIWAKAKSYSNAGSKELNSLPGYETMMAKGDNSWRLQKFGIKSWHKPPADLVEICVEKPPRADLCVVGKTDMVAGQWFHFVGVHDYPQAKLYVNGVLEAVETFDVNWKSDDFPVGFGNQSQFPEKGRWWDGWLDEARVLEVVKDAHWIKLEYESQRTGQKFLSFGKAQQRF
jgi:hypothetical protein